MNSKVISLRERIIPDNNPFHEKRDKLIHEFKVSYANMLNTSNVDNSPRVTRVQKKLIEGLTKENCEILDKYEGFKALSDLATQYPSRFQKTVTILSKHPNVIKNLEAMGQMKTDFKLDSFNLYDTIVAIKNNPLKAFSEGYIKEDGAVDLHSMVKSKTGKLRFTISEIASLNATTMFVNNSNLQKGDYEVYITGEFKSDYIDVIKKIEINMPDAEIITSGNHIKENPLTEVTFSDRSWLSLDSKSIILPMSDFKYVTPGSVPVNEMFEEKDTALSQMGLKSGDKLMVIPSSDLEMVIRIVMMKNMEVLPKNLKVVFLPRTESEEIDVLIGAQKTGHVSNISDNIKFPEGVDMFVSNTRGLASGYQKVADVVIMPHDRNGWESLVYTPTIAEPGAWKLNPTVSKAVDNGAGLWMDDNDDRLADQINEVINNPQIFKEQVQTELNDLKAMQKMAYVRAALLLYSISD